MVKEAANGGGPTSPVPLAVTARIERLILGPHHEIAQVTGQMLRRDGAWQSGRLEGRLATRIQAEQTLASVAC